MCVCFPSCLRCLSSVSCFVGQEDRLGLGPSFVGGKGGNGNGNGNGNMLDNHRKWHARLGERQEAQEGNR